MKKRIVFAISLVLSLLMGIILGYKTYENKNDMHIYKFNTVTPDSLIILENVRLLSCGTNLSLEPNFIIRKNQDCDSEIEGLKLAIIIEKNVTPNYTLTFSSEINDKDGYVSDDYSLLKGIHIDKNSTVTVHFTYEINGETYDFYNDVLLQQEC